MEMLNSSTRKLVTSVEISNMPYLSNLTCLHGCCLFFNVVRMDRMMRERASLDSVGDTHSIIVFVKTKVSMEVIPRMKVTLYKANYIRISSPGRRLVVSTVVTLGNVVIFSVYHIVQSNWFNFLENCFVSPLRVW